MEPVFKSVDAKKVIGIGAPFISILSPNRNSDRIIPALWDRFINRAGEIAAPPTSVWLGLCTLLPDGITRSDADEYFYIACREVEALAPMPDGMIGYTIPAGRYAAFIHRGTLDRFAETMRDIHEVWLPSSGFSSRSQAPWIEVYDERFDATSENSEMEIWAPIED